MRVFFLQVIHRSFIRFGGLLDFHRSERRRKPPRPATQTITHHQAAADFHSTRRHHSCGSRCKSYGMAHGRFCRPKAALPKSTRARARQRTECARRRILFADCHLSTNDPETTPILIDDGIATGATAIAALRTLRSLGFHRVLCAVPVCSRDSAASIEAECDDLITLDQPEGN